VKQREAKQRGAKQSEDGVEKIASKAEARGLGRRRLVALSKVRRSARQYVGWPTRPWAQKAAEGGLLYREVQIDARLHPGSVVEGAAN